MLYGGYKRREITEQEYRDLIGVMKRLAAAQEKYQKDEYITEILNRIIYGPPWGETRRHIMKNTKHLLNTVEEVFKNV